MRLADQALKLKVFFSLFLFLNNSDKKIKPKILRLLSRLSSLSGLFLASACIFPGAGVSVVDPGKIDEKGRFLSFPGVTVIAPVGAQNTALFENLYQMLLLKEQLTNRCALLPVSSYHMTTHNLYVENDAGKGNLRPFLQQKLPFFQSLSRRLQEAQFRPTVQVQGVAAGQTLGLRLALAQDQAQIVDSIAREFGIQDKIPAFFHITLCYFFDRSSSDLRKQLANELQAPILELFGNYGPQVTLESPQLSYFFDMTAFYPWSAATIPF